jgi:hypothetical protein
MWVFITRRHRFYDPNNRRCDDVDHRYEYDDLVEPPCGPFLDGLALCEKEGVGNLWVDDPLGLLPPDVRPTRERR